MSFTISGCGGGYRQINGKNVDETYRSITDDRLLDAAAENNIDYITSSLAKGADVDSANENGMTALKIAANMGNSSLVEFLIAKGAKVNNSSMGFAALHLAADNGNLDIVKLLIKHGAVIDCKDKTGMTPLKLASKNGDLNLSKFLLEQGANVNNDSMGYTPLFIAAYNGQLDIIELLITKGADINYKKKDGITPFSIACQEGHFDVAHYLLKKGVDTSVPDKFIETKGKINQFLGDFFIAEKYYDKSIASYRIAHDNYKTAYNESSSSASSYTAKQVGFFIYTALSQTIMLASNPALALTAIPTYYGNKIANKAYMGQINQAKALNATAKYHTNFFDKFANLDKDSSYKGTQNPVYFSPVLKDHFTYPPPPMGSDSIAMQKIYAEKMAGRYEKLSGMIAKILLCFDRLPDDKTFDDCIVSAKSSAE